MGLIGKFFSGKDDDKKGGGKSDGKSSVRRQAKMPSSRKQATPSVRKTPSAAKKPEAGAPAATGAPGAAGRLAPPSGRKSRSSSPKKRLGQLILKAGKITEPQLEKALEIQQQNGGLLGQILISSGACSKADVGAAIKQQRTITTVMLGGIKFDPEAVKALPTSFCNRNRLIAFEKIGNQICIAMANVLDAQAKNDVKEMTQLQVKPFDASLQEIQAAIKQYLPPEDFDKGKEDQRATAAAKKADDIVIELPEEELDIIAGAAELPSDKIARTAASQTVSVTPTQAGGGGIAADKKPDTEARRPPQPLRPLQISKPVEPAKPAAPVKSAEPEPETVSIEELRAARASTRQTAKTAKPETPAPAAGPVPELEETLVLPPPKSPDETVAELLPAAEPEALPAIEELEEIVELPASAAAANATEETLDLSVEDLQLEPENPSEESAVVSTPSEAAADEVLDLEEIGDIEIISPETAAEEIVSVDDLVEPEGEEEEELQLAEVEALAPVELETLPEGVLAAIPMSRGYFSEVVQWGGADPERRWLAEHLADNALPVNPAPELAAAGSAD